MRQHQLTLPGIEPQRKRVSRDRLPTNTTTHRHNVHRWFNFIAGFSPEYVELCLDDLSSPGATLLDPFAGCATAPLVGLIRGFDVLGYEPHPVFCRIGRAKLGFASARERLPCIEKTILRGINSPTAAETLPESPLKYLSKLLPVRHLEPLLGARDALIEDSLDSDDLAFLILSKVLDKCSHSQTDGIYKAPTSTKKAVDPVDATEATIGMINKDLRALPKPNNSRAKIFNSSALDMSQIADETVDIVVTSPPYLNNFDFAEMTRMHLYFWGLANSWGQITDKVRSKLLVNTTTALKGQKPKQNDYRKNIPVSVLPELDGLVASLKDQRMQRAGKKEYDFLVYPYFSQMTDILRECKRCLRPSAPIRMMIADAALYGVHISAPQLVCSIMKSLGYAKCRCEFVRKRGHRWILDKRDGSKKGLGEYEVTAVK